jgi:transposase
MPRTRPPYPPEFREQLVALHRAGRTIEELAREFEPSEQTIRNWIAQSTPAAGGTPPTSAAAALSTAEREELQRLRKEVRQLRVERDILGKAAAWFARETGTIPNSGSSS